MGLLYRFCQFWNSASEETHRSRTSSTKFILNKCKRSPGSERHFRDLIPTRLWRIGLQDLERGGHRLHREARVVEELLLFEHGAREDRDRSSDARELEDVAHRQSIGNLPLSVRERAHGAACELDAVPDFLSAAALKRSQAWSLRSSGHLGKF